MRDGQILGVSIVRADIRPGLGQGREVLLGRCRIVGVEGSNGPIGVDHQLGVGCHQDTGQYLERRGGSEGERQQRRYYQKLHD